MQAPSHRTPHRRFTVALLVLFALASVGTGPRLAIAQPATPAAGTCLVATEPNDQPADAMSLPEGPACAEATVPGSAQDLYRWVVSGEPARWTLALSGIPGQVVRLEVYTVELDDTDAAVSATKLVERAGGAGEGVSLDELIWSSGEYYVGVATSGPGSYRLDITPGDPLPPPATSTSGAFAASGAGASSLVWTLDDDASRSRYTLRLDAPVGSGLTLALSDADGQELAQLPAGLDGVAALADVGLPPGDYTLAVSGGEDVPWAVWTTATGERIVGQEDEPNESGATAMLLAFDGDSIAMSGRLALRGEGASDRDLYRFPIDDAHAGRFTDIRLLGQGTDERRLCLLDMTETELRCVSGNGGTALNDLVLAAGDYLIAVSGVPAPDSPYLLRVEVTGEAVSGFEQEPNDRPNLASPLAPDGDGWTGSGRLGTEDIDHVAVTISGEPQLWRIDLTGEAGVTVELLEATGSAVMKSDSGPNGPVINDAYLVPGTQVLRIAGAGDYTVTLTPLGPPDPQQEREPNNALDRSQPIRLAETRTGRLATAGDYDAYRFSLQGETAVRIETTAPDDAQVALQLEWQGVSVTTVETTGPGEPAVYTGTLQAGDYALWLMPRLPGEGMYEIRIDPLDPFTSPDVGTPVVEPVTATLDLGATPVAAYWPEAQRIDGEVTLENGGSDEVEVALDAKPGNPAWDVTLDAETVTVGAGETATVALSVLVAPDARAAEPVYVAVRATAPEGAASAMALVTPDGAAVPLAPEAWWPLPDSLLGGIDVAAAATGAAPVVADEIAATEQAPLYDGLPTTGTGWRTDIGSLPAELTVDLAGDEPVPIAGFAIDPAGPELWPGTWPGEVEFQLSTDGQAFETVWSGMLAPVTGERAIALDTPVEARFARLRILTAQDSTAPTVALAGWKVIARPGWELPGDRNLADPALGGHVVDLQPPLVDPTAPAQMLVPGEFAQSVLAVPGAPISIVLGFQHDRAARLAALAWVDPAASNPDARLERVTVEVSTGSPLGPWVSAGAWELARDDTGTATLAFDAPVWARFVRITGIAPGEGDAEIDVELPDVLRAIEVPAGDGYLSITGEWGGARPAASFELLEPVARPEPGEDAGNDADAATDLPLEETRTGVVAIGQDEDWYRVALPAGMPDLAVTIGGVPAIGVTVEVFDDEGEPVEAKTEQVSATELKLTASGEPGARYLLRVTQPPTSVVIAFDTSFSIGPLETTVYQGLNRFATEVQPGREFVDVLPFGETSTLLPGFSDDPYLIQGAVAAYPRTATSSDAEGAILTAGDALKGRPGTRAIVLITDGESSPTTDQMERLWTELDATGPRVFTVGIAGSDQPSRGQDVMQDWATVGGGYVYVRDQGAMDIAFARIATELRRPALYTVTAEAAATPATPQPATPVPATPAPTPLPTPALTPTSEPTATPTPTPTPTPAVVENGTLEVVVPPVEPGAPVPVSTQGQVAIILDTSGSMLQPLEGSTRAGIAKTALIDLVTTTIPPGTVVSLRTFGDTPDSCETLLAVPPGPLDPAAISQTISALPVVDLVRTPIGASLEATLGDVMAGEGPRIVVLVTDGEETCDGDPAAAIQALAASGVDVRVNIVGFAIDDPALQATFQDWARLGNGRYIDAGNAAELNEAVADAVLPTFHVIDASGAVIAMGQVGGVPMSLPSGAYRVVVQTSPVVSLAVTIEPGQQTTLTLPP